MTAVNAIIGTVSVKKNSIRKSYYFKAIRLMVFNYRIRRISIVMSFAG